MNWIYVTGKEINWNLKNTPFILYLKIKHYTWRIDTILFENITPIYPVPCHSIFVVVHHTNLISLIIINDDSSFNIINSKIIYSIAKLFSVLWKLILKEIHNRQMFITTIFMILCWMALICITYNLVTSRHGLQGSEFWAHKTFVTYLKIIFQCTKFIAPTYNN